MQCAEIRDMRVVRRVQGKALRGLVGDRPCRGLRVVDHSSPSGSMSIALMDFVGLTAA